MRLRFQRSGTPLARGALTDKIAEWAQQAETARLTTIRQQEGLYASQINAARRQHSRQACLLSPELAETAPAQHPPEPQPEAAQRQRANTVNGTQHKSRGRKPARHTHACTESEQSHLSTQQTPGCQTTSDQHSHAPHSNSHHQFLHQTGHRHTGRAPPQPCLTKDESTQEDTNQHTEPAARELPQTSSQCSPIT
jgi:hypothetical protein